MLDRQHPHVRGIALNLHEDIGDPPRSAGGGLGLPNASFRGLDQNSGRSSAIWTNSHRWIRSASFAGTRGSSSPIYTPFAPDGLSRPDNGNKFAITAVAEAFETAGFVAAAVGATVDTGVKPNPVGIEVAIDWGSVGNPVRSAGGSVVLKAVGVMGGGGGLLRKISYLHHLTCMLNCYIDLSHVAQAHSATLRQ